MRHMALVLGGIGNLIQMTAAVRTLRFRLKWDVDIFYQGLIEESGNHEQVDSICIPRVFNSKTLPPKRELQSQYRGAIALGFAALGRGDWHGIPVLNDRSVQLEVSKCKESEVAISMKACTELGVPETLHIYLGELNDGKKYKVGCGWHFDIVLANGYCRRESGHWDVKGFPGFKTVAKRLREEFPRASICSIGRTKDEYVPTTVDRTGLHILDSLSLIRSAYLLICTDSMAFHAGGVFETPTVALFTATSVIKNADPRFHSSARILAREDLECRLDCQVGGHRWRSCPHHTCQQIGINAIMNAVVSKLKEGYSGGIDEQHTRDH